MLFELEMPIDGKVFEEGELQISCVEDVAVKFHVTEFILECTKYNLEPLQPLLEIERRIHLSRKIFFCRIR